MAIYLTHTSIESFCGDVLPLQLLSDSEDLRQEPIRWSADPEAIKLRTFDPRAYLSFTNGVLLTLLKPGKTCVTASCRGVEYTCSVTVREPMRVSSDDPMQYFIGDLHTHAGKPHKLEEFAARETGFPSEMIEQLKTDGRMDFGVISDHACLLTPRDFLRGFTDADDAQPMDLVMLPGSESEISQKEFDRYGVPHKNSGEVVTFCADAYASPRSWDLFWEQMGEIPCAIGTFAHPQVVGAGAEFPGIWNFCFHKNNSPRMRSFMRLIETGKGHPKSENLIHEYAYSLALDSGFRVCPTSSSDCHGPKWGYDVFPGKTILMAPERSKEAFVDAIRNNRVYASASGNVKLRYTVNGMTAPADLPETNQYRFHVEAACFHEDPTTVPVLCQVISDGGVCVKAVEGVDFSAFDFTVESDTARYFFLRLVDAEGRKTWSVPVWTGRPVTPVNTDGLKPLDKTGCTAVDTLTGADASALLDEDPNTVWTSQQTTASILVDLKQARSFCALGHYPQIITKQLAVDAGVANKEYTQWIKQFAHAYRISVSCDGASFTQVAQGVFRSYGGEEIIRFAPCTARFLRLEILSTCGKASCFPQYADAQVTMAELTLFGE